MVNNVFQRPKDHRSMAKLASNKTMIKMCTVNSNVKQMCQIILRLFLFIFLKTIMLEWKDVITHVIDDVNATLEKSNHM